MTATAQTLDIHTPSRVILTTHHHANPNRGTRHGRSTSSISALLAALSVSYAHAQTPTTPSATDTDLFLKIAIAIGSILIAQAIIPVIKAAYTKHALRKTYQAYLRTHVANTLESFQGAGSTRFAKQVLTPSETESDWFSYLEKHNLGIPTLFLAIIAVIEKAEDSDSYIPSVSYPGTEGSALEPSSAIWQLKQHISGPAVTYFLTQRQVETTIDYQYSGWYFDLIKSTDKDTRARWCDGLRNILFDLAQHYHAAIKLQRAL